MSKFTFAIFRMDGSCITDSVEADGPRSALETYMRGRNGDLIKPGRYVVSFNGNPYGYGMGPNSATRVLEVYAQSDLAVRAVTA